MTQVAFVGVGRMGLPMARNLLAAGHRVVAADVDRAALDRIREDGAEIAPTHGRAAAGAGVVITTLPSPPVVERVMLAEDGILSAASPGTVVIDMSTGPPSLARRLAAEGDEAGIEVLDAPVSGGPPGAEAGTLAVMVGGAESTFERVRGLLGAIGSNVIHMGPAGTGQATKLCNNLLAGVHMAALSESVAIARREGLDPRKLLEVLSSGTGDSRVLRMRFPVPGVLPEAPASRDFTPLFPVDLIAKDLGLAIETARAHELATPTADVALERYRLAQREDLGDRDYSVISTLADRPHHPDR